MPENTATFKLSDGTLLFDYDDGSQGALRHSDGDDEGSNFITWTNHTGWVIIAGNGNTECVGAFNYGRQLS